MSMTHPAIQEQFLMSGEWYPQAEALLDEHHVVAVNDDERLRIEFGSHVAMQADRLIDAEVVPIYGRFVGSMEQLAYMLSRGLPSRRPIEPSVDGVIAAMRHVGRGTHRRYVVWHDAQVMAEQDPMGFRQAADAMMGVAAEQEYASEDVLVLTRCLFIGPVSLAGCAAFAGWWREAREQALWQVVSGLTRPPVLTVELHKRG